MAAILECVSVQRHHVQVIYIYIYIYIYILKTTHYYYYYSYYRISHFSALAVKYSPILGCSNQQD